MGGGLIAGLMCLLFTGGAVVKDDMTLYERRHSFHPYPLNWPMQYTLKNDIYDSYFNAQFDPTKVTTNYSFPDPIPADFDIRLWSKYKAQEIMISKGYAPADYAGVFHADKYDPWQCYRDHLEFNRLHV